MYFSRTGKVEHTACFLLFLAKSLLPQADGKFIFIASFIQFCLAMTVLFIDEKQRHISLNDTVIKNCADPILIHGLLSFRVWYSRRSVLSGPEDS